MMLQVLLNRLYRRFVKPLPLYFLYKSDEFGSAGFRNPGMRRKGRKRGGFQASLAPAIMSLEDRILLAGFTDATPALSLTLAAHDAVGIVANASTYTLNLTSGTWSGTDDANVSGNGTATLTVQEAAFNQINLIDAGAGTSVTFNDSGSNSYASNFNIALTDAAAGPIAFNGATSFTGSNALSASTSGLIVANSGATVSANAGNVTLGANAITFDNGHVSSATGNVTLTANGGSITEAAANAGADVSGAIVTLITTGSGNQIGTAPPVGGSGTPLKVNATTLLNASTSDGFITLANTSGNIPLGTLNAGAALIELTAVGAITDGKGGAGSPNLTAADGTALATTGSNSAIGTSALPIRTAIGALTATTNDGGIYVSDSNGPGLIINSVLAKEGGFAPVLNKSSQVVVNGNAGTDNVSVTATGPIVLNNAATVITTVAAPNAVTITSTGVGGIVEGQTGSVNVLAQSVTLTANGSIGVSGGAIGLMGHNFSASTANGSIFLSELIPGTAVSVSAGGAGNNVSITGFGATLGIGTVIAPGTVMLQETVGGLVSGVSMNVTGQTVSLTGKSGIGSSGSPFTVTAGNLSATADNSAVGIFVGDTTTASSVSATTNAGDVAITYSGGGSLEFTALTGLLSASGGATVSFDNTGGNVELGAVNASSITASGAITAAANVNVTGGTVTLTAGTGIGVDPTTGIGTPSTEIKTNVVTLNANTASGDIVIVQAANPLTVSATSKAYSNPSAMTGSDVNVEDTTGNLTVGTISALGTVTLTTGVALSAPNGSAVSLTANTLNLTAANGIGTSSAVVRSSANILSANGGAGGGLFLSNNKTLSVTSASASGGAVSITTLGDLDVGSVTAAGQGVTLSAGGALIDSNGPALNVTAQSATVSGSSIGGPGDPLETQVSSITAMAADGVLEISDLGTGSLTLTASATGPGSDIDFTSAGSVVLTTVTTQGNTVSLMAAGSITTAIPQPTVNITAQTLDVVAPGGIGTSGNPLEVLVGQVATADGGTPGVFMNNAGPLAITKEALEAPGIGTLTFDAASITIEDMGGTTVELAPGRSLLLRTQTGPIVFLNPADTIEASNGSTITVNAGTIPGSGGVAVIGNLTTEDSSITVTADGSITIGLLNAGTGNVTVQSASGLILKGNAPNQPNIIAGSATLSGNAPTARQLQLNEESAISAAAGASAEAAAAETLLQVLKVRLPIAIAEVGASAAGVTAELAVLVVETGVLESLTGALQSAAALATVGADIGQIEDLVKAVNEIPPDVLSQFQVEAEVNKDSGQIEDLIRAMEELSPEVLAQFGVGGLLGVEEGVVAADAIAVDVAGIAEDVANPIGGAAQAIPLTGDFGAEAADAALVDVTEALQLLYDDANFAEEATQVEASEAESSFAGTAASLFGELASLGVAVAALQADLVADGIAEAAAENTLLQSETAQVVSNQAIAATDQANVIGSLTDPIGIQVSGVLNVSAGPTDSYLQVVGDTAIDQIVATGSVTLISTGAITNGAPANTANIVATGLTIQAVNGIGTAANPLLTRVGTLNAINTGSGDIDISNTYGAGAALSITGISNSGGGNVVISNKGNVAAGQGITVNGPISAIGAGTVTINSGSPLTIAANVTSASAITLSAAESPTPGDDLTVNPGVTIQSTTSSVTLQAGDNVTVPTGSTIEASTTITITADHNNADTTGANVVVAGTLIAPSALINVDATDSSNNTFTITPSVTTPITVNGGLGNDTLNFNANGLPVTILGNQITAAGDQPVTFNNVEAVNILNPAGGGSITLNAAAGINDALSLTGTGPGAGTFTLNGGAPISFTGVSTFVYNGGTQNEAIAVSPFATPVLQWGVAVAIDGRTGGIGTAALTYNNVAGVSNNISIQPSAPGAGQLIDTNAATSASIAVVTYIQTNNFVINGSSNGSTGATDNLFINGTDSANPGASGNDDALANFQATGNVTHPMVRIYDAGAGAIGGRSPSAAELNDTAGTAANDLFNLQSFTNFSTFRIGLLGGNDVLDLLAGAQTGPLAPLAINYLGGTGNDSLIVDSSNGPVLGPINYDGGPGTNYLTLTGGTATSDVYSPGSQLGAGTNTLVFSGGIESVSFQNLAPIFDQVAGPLLVNATNSNNAITYQGGNDTTNALNPAWGQVSVDNLEPINFINKSALTINGLAGTDTFSVNNPNTPTGLGGIAISGSGSTGSDALIVNGVGATVGVNLATAAITGATGTGGAVPITYNTIGTLTVKAGPSTGLAISNSNTFLYTPGSTADAGTVQTSTLPISFTGLGAGKTLALTGSGAGASLVANDPTANDTFTVASTSGIGNVTLATRATITTTAISSLTLNGLTGVDAFNVTGPLPYTSTTLAGGGAAVASLNGNGMAVTANLGGVTASVSGGGLGTVALPGIGILNLNAGAGNITLAGTAASEAFTVTPTGPNTATGQVGSLSPVVNTTNTGSLTTDAGAGSDTLTVNGTSNSDTINVSGAAATVVGLKSINYTNVESLQVNGLTGSDTFNVTSSATVPISIDGSDPIAVLPGDQLNVVTNSGDTVTLNPGPTSDQGGLVVNSNQPVSFVHIESTSVSGGGTPVINGTNGNDVISIVADGVQAFTVSDNSGPSFQFTNTPSLNVNAQAGSNQIVLQSLANWNVNVTINGGVPSVTNQLVVITPGTDQATYTPASANSGTLGIGNSNVVFTNIESFLYDGQSGGDKFAMVGTSGANAFMLTPGGTNDAGTLSMDSTLAVAFQNLGTSGQVVVNGNGGADSLVYNGTAANDGFIIDSSASGGQVSLNARVPVLTQNIPTLSLEGLAGDDTFTLLPTIGTNPYTTLNLDGGATASATGNQANLTAATSSALSVQGQTITQGGKKVAGTSLQNINLYGAGNKLTYNYVPGVTEAINIIASPMAGQGQVSIPNVALWTFTSVPVVYVNGNVATNDTLTITGTNNSDVFQINLNAAGTDTEPVLKLQNTSGNILLTLGNYTGFSQLNVYSLDGGDTFNVYTGPTVSRNLYVNGNLPSGKKKLTNVLNVIYVMPRPKIVQSAATQNPSSGLVSLDYGTSKDLIQYDGIQNVTIGK
jgi:hypothetical protein